MKILFIAKPLSSKGNGVVSSLKTEIQYLQETENVALYNIGVSLDKEIVNTLFDINNFKNINSLPEPFNRPDLIVFEEVYKFEYIKLYKECIKLKIPYIIIPHGCLVTIEQQKKRIKHFVANILFFNKFIKNARAVEFLNIEEKISSRFLYKKYVIIPNSIEFRKIKYKRNKKIFKFIYVGRYAVVTKGLDLLINTFIEIKDWCENNNVILELYGPIEESEELNNLKRKIEDNNCKKIIKINGPIYNEMKEKKLQEATIFIQTSRNEGQPMGIIEALSYGIPCVVTYQTNFGTYCDDNKCGIGINFDSGELKKAIYKIYNDKDFFEKCKKNSIKSVKRDFELKKVTKLRREIYKNLIK